MAEDDVQPAKSDVCKHCGHGIALIGKVWYHDIEGVGKPTSMTGIMRADFARYNILCGSSYCGCLRPTPWTVEELKKTIQEIKNRKPWEDWVVLAIGMALLILTSLYLLMTGGDEVNSFIGGLMLAVPISVGIYYIKGEGSKSTTYYEEILKRKRDKK